MKPDFNFPRPMLHSKNFDFSFSGLKTSVLYFLRDNKDADPRIVALEFENAVVDTLVYKLKKTAEKHKVKTIIIGGGVAANRHLQRELKKNLKGAKILFPDKKLTGDNALMTGVAGYLEYIRNKKKTPKPGSIRANGNLSL